MLNRLLCAIALLLLMISPIAAQDDAPFPVVDEAAIFAEGVTIIERLPVLNFDNEARELYYFDPDDGVWETYVYPNEVHNLDYYPAIGGSRIVQEGEKYLLNSGLGNPYVVPVNYVWIFDPFAEQFSRPESQCGRAKAALGRGQWVLELDKVTDLFHFCHTETGEITSPLPTEIGELCEQSMNDALFSILYSTSPDGEWVVFTDCNQTYTSSDFGYRIYAYHPASETYHVLGDTAQFESIEFSRWLDNTTLIIHGDTLGTQHDRYIYLADVTQEKGLVLAAEQYVSWPQYYDDPSRYVWFGWDNQNVYEYNLETRHSRQIANVGCESVFSFCVAIPNPDYALLAVEDSVWQSDLPGHIYVYTMPDNNLIYSREYGSSSGFSENDRSVVWIDNNRFLANGYLIDALEATEIAHFSYLDPSWLSPAKSYLVIQGDTNSFGDELNIVNLSDFSEIPLTNTSCDCYFHVDEWLSTSEMKISVYDNITLQRIAQWHIRIDAISEAENS